MNLCVCVCVCVSRARVCGVSVAQPDDRASRVHAPNPHHQTYAALISIQTHIHAHTAPLAPRRRQQQPSPRQDRRGDLILPQVSRRTVALPPHSLAACLLCPLAAADFACVCVCVCVCVCLRARASVLRSCVEYVCMDKCI